MTEANHYPPPLHRDRLVHILDPDPSVCEALSVLFRLEGFQTAFSIDTASFFAALERRRPDAIVLNQRLGGEAGLGVLRRIKAMRIGAPVFMLQDEPRVEAAVMAMKGGAADVLTKPIDTDHLVGAVRDALRQDIHIGSSEVGRLIEVRGFSQLTAREREVLELITNGQSNKEAGRLLGISPRTIEVHRARVMEKLGAKNTADLMRIVLTS
jgi:two-component system response regulator FixJ